MKNRASAGPGHDRGSFRVLGFWGPGILGFWGFGFSRVLGFWVSSGFGVLGFWVFRFPFNNILHHQVEQIVVTCLDSCIPALFDHLFKTCELVARLVAADGSPNAPDTRPEVGEEGMVG